MLDQMREVGYFRIGEWMYKIGIPTTHTLIHYQGSLLRPWPQKMAVFCGQWWHLDPHSPVLINISADNRSLNQFTVKTYFFINHQNILPLTPSYCSWKSNRLVSQMRATLAACREPAGKSWQLCKVLYVFEHKTQYLLIHAPFTCIVVFWHISKVPPMIL